MILIKFVMKDIYFIQIFKIILNINIYLLIHKKFNLYLIVLIYKMMVK